MIKSVVSSSWRSFLIVILLVSTISTKLIAPTVALTPTSKSTFSSAFDRKDANVLNRFSIEKNGYRKFSPFQRSSVELYFSRSEGSINDNDVTPINLEEGKDLQWNVISILQKHDRHNDIAKREVLRNVYQKAMKAIEQDALLLNNNMKNNLSQQPPAVRLPANLSSMRRFLRTSSMDKDHEGHFRIFLDDTPTTDKTEPDKQTNKTTMPSNLLFSMDRPLSFIRDTLSNPSDKTMKGSMICDNTETVVFCVQDDQNLKYTSRVLDDMPLAQLQMGGNLPDCQIQLNFNTVQKLKSLNLLVPTVQNDLNGIMNMDDDNETILCNIKSQDLEIIRTFLDTNDFAFISQQKKNNGNDSNVQKTLMKLIDVAVESARKGLIRESNEPHLVLVTHSTSASIVASALSTWKQQRIIRNSNSLPFSSLSSGSDSNKSIVSRVEDLLHTAITVVTVGAVCQQFCDGPAYIHISMLDDHLARTLGVTRDNTKNGNSKRNRTAHGGKNAVYFHTWSPYDITESNINRNSLRYHDAHNMNACAIQFLYLIMRINGITSFRALYDAANYVDPRAILDIDPCNFAINYDKHGDLVIPSRIDIELLPAMIRASCGEHCLWNPPLLSCGEDEDECPLPDEIESKTYLEESFGYNAYEEIYETCCSPSNICPIGK